MYLLNVNYKILKVMKSPHSMLKRRGQWSLPEEDIDYLLDEDEISLEEAGFMHGYHIVS